MRANGGQEKVRQAHSPVPERFRILFESFTDVCGVEQGVGKRHVQMGRVYNGCASMPSTMPV